jgi:hypothetical protein
LGNVPTDHLFVGLNDLKAGAGVMSVQLWKVNEIATVLPGSPTIPAAANITDNIGGDASESSGILLRGDGNYLLLVSRTFSTVSEGYTLTFHCQDTTSTVHTVTTIQPIQNF